MHTEINVPPFLNVSSRLVKHLENDTINEYKQTTIKRMRTGHKYKNVYLHRAQNGDRRPVTSALEIG